MLIRPDDAALDDDEWKALLADHDFGQLIVPRSSDLPVVVPTHFIFDDDHVLLHLARPNPVWDALANTKNCLFSVVGPYVYIPSVWNTPPGRDPQLGVPTSYYAAVQLSCAATAIDDPVELIELLRRQLAHFEPDKNPDDLSEASPYGRLLGAIRGLRLDIVEVRAKFKFGGNRSPDHQRDIAARMLDRDGPMDAAASEQQRRRRESRGAR